MTTREKVRRRLEKGESREQIAKALGLSTAGVDYHRRKLAVNSAAAKHPAVAVELGRNRKAPGRAEIAESIRQRIGQLESELAALRKAEKELSS